MENNLTNNVINCSKCGAANMQNTKFCVKCGNPFQMVSNTNDSVAIQNNMNQSISTQQVDSVYVKPVQVQTTQNVEAVRPVQTTEEVKSMNSAEYVNSQTMNMPNYTTVQSNTTINNTKQKTSQMISSTMNYFKYMVQVLLKPYKAFKKEEKKLEDPKNSIILTSCLVVGLIIINLINTMYNTVRVKSIWSGEVKWVWENLKNIDYFKVIGQNLLVYVGVIVLIAGIYYLANLVLKKESNFFKFLGISTTAYVIFSIFTVVLSPILSAIYAPLGLGVMLIGFIYWFVVLIELMNDVVTFDDKNSKIYYHVCCLSIFIVLVIIFGYKMLFASLSL